MDCLICLENIKSGEQIFFGNQMECSGPGEIDCVYSESLGGLMGAVHISCLNNSLEVVKTRNTAIPECYDQEVVVQRSNALDLL